MGFAVTPWPTAAFLQVFTSVMIPENSWPGFMGNLVKGRFPAMLAKSDPQTPTRSTPILTQPG